MITEQRAEDYLKYVLMLGKKQEVHGIHLAGVLGISKATVSVALKHLEQDGYVTLDENRAVSLTPKGMEIALRTYEKNQFFENFLLEIGVEPEVAQEDARHIEHVISAQSFEALKRTLTSLREQGWEPKPPENGEE